MKVSALFENSEGYADEGLAGVLLLDCIAVCINKARDKGWSVETA